MALGFVEVQGVTAAITVLDIMCKTADITPVTWEKKWGGRLVTIIIQGEVSAVQQAVEAAKTGSLKPPAATGVLPNPHPEIIRLVSKSKGRWPK